jgi:hypothetical protein
MSKQEKKWEKLSNENECGLKECGLTESKKIKNETNLTKKTNEEKK